MHRFWENVINPIINEIKPSHIVEIGCKDGKNTRKILEYCMKNEAKATLIDPYPDFNKKEFSELYGDIFNLYEDLSLNVLYKLEYYDVILIDGDHNYYTVYNELLSVEKQFAKSNFPVVFIHDVSWPYARRDLYYNPSTIPDQFRLPYEKKGILPNQGKLADCGLNAHLNNAIYENDSKNGILTAIEDFLNQSNGKFIFYRFSVFNGLGIIIPEEKVNIIEFINRINIKDKLLTKLEENRNELEIYITNQRLKISQIKKNLNMENLQKEEKDRTIKKLGLELKEKSLELEKFNINQIEMDKKKIENFRTELNSNITQMNIKEDIIVDLNKKLNDQDNRLGDYKRELNLLKKTHSDTLIKLQQKDNSYRSAKFEANIHLNSIRYKIGNEIVNASNSPKQFLKLPFKLYKLYKEGKAKKQKKEVQNKQEEKRNYFEVSAVNAKSIVNENLKMLKYNSGYSEPRVSIIILNRNGSSYLESLFNSILDCTTYTNYELIIVENNSSDNSLEIINQFSSRLKIKVIRNEINETFSRANNKAALIAEGSLLLFLNNDVEVTDGWLSELVGCYLNYEEGTIGAVGAKLLYPLEPNSKLNMHKAFKVQHAGIYFREEEEFIRPYNRGNGLEAFDPRVKKECTVPAITGAALLIKKVVFEKVGGFDENFIYGYEDVDLSLKLIQNGYKNIYCPSALLFHYEFGTQDKNDNSEIKKRRLNNQKVLKDKWYFFLQKEILSDAVYNTKLFTEKQKTVAFAVTEYGPNATAGDYFTALELGEAFKELGYQVRFLPRKGPEDWYKLTTDVDILISLLESYNPDKIKGKKENLITIAWARNWFDKWVDSDGYKHYNIICASSPTACKFMEEKSSRKVHLLEIATNPKRFNNMEISSIFESCDYVFTGSYWNDPREITSYLNPEELPYKFFIYGKNWENVPELKKYHKGFVNYSDIPMVYDSTKLVIDDANRVTKPYGAVNSRVFDAIAAGKLVITNGKLGSEETFQGLLPSFSTKDELNNLIQYYLENDDIRAWKVSELQKFVFENHTYKHRAIKILDIIKDMYCNKKSIVFKVPAPNWDVAKEWGDYHFALALEKYFKRINYRTLIQILPEWNNDEDKNYENIFVLRGLSQYKPKIHHFNIMWNISHPDKISIEEYNLYDQIFVASKEWTKYLKAKINVPTECLLQCTDPELFFPENVEKKYQLLFVGNSRKVFRKIIKDVIPTDYDLSVYGTNWEKFIDKKYIKGQNIENSTLTHEYSAAEILLNDHWESMADKSFVSNRIFDAMAAKVFVISDYVKDAEDIFGDSLVMYKDKNDLKTLIDFYTKHPEKKQIITENGYDLVVNNHTFEKRVEEIASVLQERKLLR